MEQHRSLRGHFNILHCGSGYKADIYLAGNDPHPMDIRAILGSTAVELDVVENWVQRLGLEKQWDEVRGSDA